MSAQVTAMGIRDGDPAVLDALVHRRGAAVLAYCERACAPGLALDAVADAFVRFRADILAAEDPGAIDPETSLLSATRDAAAARAPVSDSSPDARAIEERFLAAEEAFRAAPRDALPEPVSQQIVATMAALAGGEEVDPAATEEWTVPADELGESAELAHEIAAARAEHDASVPPPPPAPADGHGRPGRAALVPAAAVVAIAAIAAMAASGIFGGNDPSPAVDTRIVPERALQAVPEGEAAAVVDDLRAAAADARRRRLAERRQQLAAQQAVPAPVPDETTTAPQEQPATGAGTQPP